MTVSPTCTPVACSTMSTTSRGGRSWRGPGAGRYRSSGVTWFVARRRVPRAAPSSAAGRWPIMRMRDGCDDEATVGRPRDRHAGEVLGLRRAAGQRRGTRPRASLAISWRRAGAPRSTTLRWIGAGDGAAGMTGGSSGSTRRLGGLDRLELHGVEQQSGRRTIGSQRPVAVGCCHRPRAGDAAPEAIAVERERRRRLHRRRDRIEPRPVGSRRRRRGARRPRPRRRPSGVAARRANAPTADRCGACSLSGAASRGRRNGQRTSVTR